MRNFFLILLSFLSLSSLAQCPGQTISNQSQIDQFSQNYPGCSIIEGDLIISGSNIQNLNGLSQITSITGNLKIQSTQIDDFYGLENLTTIGGNCEFRYNNSIVAFNGLSGLQVIGGSLKVIGNNNLINLMGLNSLTTINAYLDIQSNYKLNDLAGLNSLSLVGGGTRISRNNILHNLEGLNNLTVSDGYLSITSNPLLEDITALNNLIPSHITSIDINSNYKLEVCNLDPICSFLSNPTGRIAIYNNAPGCYNSYFIANSCGISPICLPYGDYFIMNQSDVDNFHTYYPDCLNLQGEVYIAGNTISNLNGLIGINRVSKSLWIENTVHLKDLSGLDSLTFIGGDFEIGFYDNWPNDSLESLHGLEKLDTINKALMILNNPMLIDLNPLSALRMVGDSIALSMNLLLTNINGLTGINADSLSALNIHNNPLLSGCSIESVCDYLNIPGSLTQIINNAEGCNSVNQIQDECITSIESIDEQPIFTVYPNPVNGFLFVKIMLPEARYKIIDILGSSILEGQLISGNNLIKLNNLRSGLYFFRLIHGNQSYQAKIIKTN